MPGMAKELNQFSFVVSILHVISNQKSQSTSKDIESYEIKK